MMDRLPRLPTKKGAVTRKVAYAFLCRVAERHEEVKEEKERRGRRLVRSLARKEKQRHGDEPTRSDKVADELIVKFANFTLFQSDVNNLRDQP